MAKLVIFGTTEMAALTHFYFSHDTSHEVVAFTVDRDHLKEETLFGVPIIAFEEAESKCPPSEYKMYIAIRYAKLNKLRSEKYYQAKAKGYELVNYISSKAVIWPGLIIGDNCFIAERSTCAPSAIIGNNVIIFHNCNIGHHAVVKDHCYLAPNTVLSDGVTVEEYSFVGANSTVVDNITIARECVVGAGALLLNNTRKKGVYRGNPAKPLPIASEKLKRI